MAIYHFAVQVASRSVGKSAVAMAAYRSGEKLKDNRTGEEKYYRREVKPETVILAPDRSPAWVYERGHLWNEVEAVEKRKDSQLCREINIALPKEFSPDIQSKTLRDFCQREFVDRGMIADIAIHRDDLNNPHAHVMLTMRIIGEAGFGAKNRDWNELKLVESWRGKWADQVNREFERAQRPERIDHRSFERQGITERLPTIHEGHIVRQMETRGIITDRGTINRSVRLHNAIVVDLEQYRLQKEALRQKTAPTTTRSLRTLEREYESAMNKRNGAKTQIEELEWQIQRIGDPRQLEDQRTEALNELNNLEPKNVWQRIRNGNRMKELQEQVSNLNEKIDKLQPLKYDLSVVHGVFKALDSAFKAIEQEYKRQLREQTQERLKHRMQQREHQRDDDRSSGR